MGTGARVLTYRPVSFVSNQAPGLMNNLWILFGLLCAKVSPKPHKFWRKSSFPTLGILL